MPGQLFEGNPVGIVKNEFKEWDILPSFCLRYAFVLPSLFVRSKGTDLERTYNGFGTDLLLTLLFKDFKEFIVCRIP